MGIKRQRQPKATQRQPPAAQRDPPPPRPAGNPMPTDGGNGASLSLAYQLGTNATSQTGHRPPVDTVQGKLAGELPVTRGTNHEAGNTTIAPRRQPHCGLAVAARCPVSPLRVGRLGVHQVHVLCITRDEGSTILVGL